MRYLMYLVLGVAAFGGTAAIAQGVAVNTETAIVQISGPVDRAAGNGSMGMGEGLRDRNEDSRSQADEPRPTSEPAETRDPNADPGHGGNETNMEHRRRPRLGDGRD